MECGIRRTSLVDWFKQESASAISPWLEYGHGLFFFQAEDGIRDIGVTGVQTCALPISDPRDELLRLPARVLVDHLASIEVNIPPLGTCPARPDRKAQRRLDDSEDGTATG